MRGSMFYFSANAFISPIHVCWRKSASRCTQASITSRGLSDPIQQSPNYFTTRKRHSSGFPVRSITAQDTQYSDRSHAHKLAVLVSGSGRSVENLCKSIEEGRLTRCEVALVIASKGKAGAIERVKKYGVPTRVIRPIDYEKDIVRFSNAISEILDSFSVDLVVMAGWMHFYVIPDRYFGKVLNIHPSLIPSFCGQGFYGSRVHEAVVRL